MVHGLVLMRSDGSQSVPCKGGEISMGLDLGLAVRGIYTVTFPADQEYIQVFQRPNSVTEPHFRQKNNIPYASKHEILHLHCKRDRLLRSRVIHPSTPLPPHLTSASPAAPSPKTSNPLAPTQPQLAPLSTPPLKPSPSTRSHSPQQVHQRMIARDAIMCLCPRSQCVMVLGW